MSGDFLAGPRGRTRQVRQRGLPTRGQRSMNARGAAECREVEHAVPAQTSGFAGTAGELSHPGRHTPSGQRRWRTGAKHLASCVRPERLTKSDAAMMAEPPRASRLPGRASTVTPDACQRHHPAHHPGTRQDTGLLANDGTALGERTFARAGRRCPARRNPGRLPPGATTTPRRRKGPSSRKRRSAPSRSTECGSPTAMRGDVPGPAWSAQE